MKKNKYRITKILIRYKDKISKKNLSLLEDNIHNFKNMKKNQNLCNLAVRINGLMIKYVPEKFQTWDLRVSAVKCDGISLSYVFNQTKVICKYAILNNPYAIRFIKRDQFFNDYMSFCLISLKVCVLKKKNVDKLLSYIPNSEIKNDLKKMI